MDRGAIIAYIQEQNKHTVFEALGIEVTNWDPESVTVSIEVSSKHLQHVGYVHGGIYVLLAESAASIAACLKNDVREYDVFGMEINANHIHAAKNGRIDAVAKLLHHGRTSMVYHIDVKDDCGRLLCVSRCTVAIRKKNNCTS